MGRLLTAVIAGIGMLAWSSEVVATDLAGIYVLSAAYGKPGHAHLIDITTRLQDLCGSKGSSCDIWCAQSTFGGRSLGKKALCRVIYRCPDDSTRSAEASRDEPILMRCTARPDGLG